MPYSPAGALPVSANRNIAAPAFGSVNTTFLRVFFALVGLAAMLLLLRTPMQFHGKLKAIMVLGIINSGVPFLMYAMG